MNQFLLLIASILLFSCGNTALIGDEEQEEQEEQETMMSVYTDFPYAIQDTYATCEGSVTSPWAGVTARGICWSTERNPSLDDAHAIEDADSGDFVSQLTDLIPSTEYYVRAYGTNKYGTEYGRNNTFTTMDELEPSCQADENSMFFNLQTITFNNYSSGEDEEIHGAYGYSATGSNGDITFDFHGLPTRGKYRTTNQPSDLGDFDFTCFISGTFGAGSAFWQSKKVGEVYVDDTVDGKISITFCNASFGAGGGFNLTVENSFGNLIFD